MFVLIGTSYLIPAYTSNQPYGITVKGNTIDFIDFASHFNFVKSTLLKSSDSARNASVYSLENHLDINSEWAGTKIGLALPFGYSPTMLWVLAPLVFLTHSTAYCLFNLFGLMAVWWQTHPIRSRFGISMLSFFSPPAFACFFLGQTAVLTGAGLLYLYEKTKDTTRAIRWRPLVLSSIVLWALTAKPPFAVTAASILIGLRTWRPVALAVVLTAVTTVIISPMLGDGWWRDYLNLLTHYDKVLAAPEYSWSLHPELMTNLRGVLSVDFGIADNVASKISSGIWIVILVAIASFAPLMKFSTGGLWSFGILSYLAFCPHVSDTEEIQLLLLIPFCISPSEKSLRWQDLFMLVVVTLACFASPLRSIFFDSNNMVLFIIKIALMILVAMIYRLRQVDPFGGVQKACWSEQG